MIQQRPQMLDKLGRNVSLGALVAMLVFLPFQDGVDASYLAAQIVVLVGFVIRLAGQVPRRFWIVAVAAFAVSMGLFTGAHAIYAAASEDNLFGVGEVAVDFLRQLGALYFCMILVFLSQFVYRPRLWTPHDRWTRITLGCMWGFGVIAILSAVFSTHPIESFEDARHFIIPYILVYMIVVETLYSWRHYKIVITTVCLMGVIVSMATLGLRYAYVKGGPDVQRVILDDHYWVRDQKHTDPNTGEAFHEIRNAWPLEHPNRLCAYAMMICFFVWLQFFVTRNWELKTLVAISVLLPFVTLLATLTRGGWLGLAAGMAALILMVNWRVIWVFLALMAATWWISPEPVRNKVVSIFNPQTYFGTQGTASDRILIWRRGFEAAGERPVLGLGYGWTQFERWWQVKEYPPLKSGQNVSHSHNNFLQVAVETGLLGLTAFIAFCGALVVQIFRALLQTERRTKRRFVVAGFFGLLVAMMVFGMSNYSLRYRMGMLYWVCFGLMTLLPAVLRFIPEDEAQEEGMSVARPQPPNNGADPEPPEPANA